jgi:DNA-binding MarR family transcriptional regulator
LKKVIKEVKNQECKMLSSPSGELVYAMHVLHSEIEKRLDAVLTKKEGLTLSQYLVLVGFSDKESSLSQAKLAERLRLTEATVSRHIGILVKRNLLERRKEGTNKKSYSLYLTQLGILVFQKTEELLLEAMDTYLSILTTKEKNGITAELKKVITVLQSTM